MTDLFTLIDSQSTQESITSSIEKQTASICQDFSKKQLESALISIDFDG